MGVWAGYRLHLFFAAPNRISVELSSGLSTGTALSRRTRVSPALRCCFRKADLAPSQVVIEVLLDNGSHKLNFQPLTAFSNVDFKYPQVAQIRTVTTVYCRSH